MSNVRAPTTGRSVYTRTEQPAVELRAHSVGNHLSSSTADDVQNESGKQRQRKLLKIATLMIVNPDPEIRKERARFSFESHPPIVALSY